MRRRLLREIINLELDTASAKSALIGAVIVVAMVVAVSLIVSTVQSMLA